VWRVRLGRVRLFLLDTDLPENAPWDRELSARLYGGGSETRIQQEIILGIGGVRALRALGIQPTVWHLNEGHAAFVALQRIREIIEQGRSFDDALEEVKQSTVFTTHTPVPAGHDAFPFHLVEKHLAGTWGEIGQHRQSFLSLGEYDNGSGSLFNMTALALRTSAFVNGVSALHGEVTRSMWRPMWPDTPADQIPVRSITNGVHVPTWMAGPVFALLDHHFGPGWLDHVDEPELWERLNDIPDAEVWQMRQSLRNDLFSFIRERMRSRFLQEHVGQSRIVSAGAMLDPEALTLGYARRFTAYKRPEMIFHDPDRLARILNKIDQPVQIVFAGKAHPADEPAKHNLQRVFKHALDPKVRRAPRLHRGLRHARRALSRAGLRRVAQQPAQAARSQRHQRHEGVAERRAALEHRRRLVGGRLQWPQRMADRERRQPRRSRRHRRGRCQRALRAA
jgi:starch phosphorylase